MSPETTAKGRFKTRANMPFHPERSRPLISCIGQEFFGDKGPEPTEASLGEKDCGSG